MKAALPRPKIVLLGMLTRIPVAGVAWLVGQYMSGFERLGYEVLREAMGGMLHEAVLAVRGVGKAAGQAAWCPVLRHHYLRAGNVPNAAVSHACVTDYYKAETPCEQLVCYQPRPLF